MYQPGPAYLSSKISRTFQNPLQVTGVYSPPPSTLNPSTPQNPSPPSPPNLCNSQTMFGVLFPDRSFPMDASAFTQVDPLHWILDLSPFTAPGAYRDVADLCVFLLPTAPLPPNKALAVYAQAPGHPFLFCGAVSAARPSAVLALPWPDPADAPPAADALALTGPDASAKIGVSVEDVAALPPTADAGAERRIERLALKVGENLFNFMQSFCGVDGSRLVVPMDILDRWFKKFQERAKKDPSYLKGFAL